MAVVAPASAPPTTTPPPLFAGYTLVALVAAWVAGIVLHTINPLSLFLPLFWLLVAIICGALWLGGWLLRRRSGALGAGVVWRALLVVGMLGCWVALGAARAAWSDPASDAHSIARYAAGAKLELRGVVATEPDLRTGYRMLTVDVTQVNAHGTGVWQPASGRIEASVYGPDDWFAPAYGDSVSLNGKLVPISAGYAPPGVLARMTQPQVTILARDGGNPVLAWLFNLRVRLAQGIQRSLPEPEAALLIGILLGLKTPTLRARLPLFTATGTIHLVVPAGLKVSTLAELATFAVRRLGPWPRTLAALTAVTLYAALGGGGPAAIRAAIMGALLALAPALGRAYNVFTALAVAAFVMTVLEPLVIYDAGFQLTVLATFGLPLLVPPISRWLLRWLRVLPGAGVISELLAVTLAAQIATLPVLALTFQQLSLVAPLANLLTVPLLAPLLVLGGALALASIVAVPVGPLMALGLAWVTWPLLWLVDRVIETCAHLPAASFAVPNVPGIFALVYYALLAGVIWWLVPWLRRRAIASSGVGGAGSAASPAAHGGGHSSNSSSGHVRLSRWALAALLALALLGAGGAAAPALAATSTQLDFLDVGAGGGAILLRLPSGVTALINGGADGVSLERALAGKLPFWQRSFDLALLTDPRPGEARGLEDAATHFTIARAADAGMRHPSTEYIAWLDAARMAGATHVQVRAGDVMQLGPSTQLRVLAPPQQLYPAGAGDTTASDDLVLRLDTPGLRALLLGSADAYALDALAYSSDPLAADVVEVALVPGAPLDLSGPLGTVMAKAHPRLVVITDAPVAPGSPAAHAAANAGPWATDSDAAMQLGALIYRTATAGTISLTGGANGWSLG